MTSLFTFRWLFGGIDGRRRGSTVLPVALAVAVLASSAGCAAVYPEIKTPVKPVPAGRELDPPPPTDVLFIAIREVEIPTKTRDGRTWDADTGGSAPDPYAKLFLNRKELFTTATESNTLNPKWPDAPKQNYDVPEDAVLTIELWDDNPLHSHPICAKDFKNLHEAALEHGELVALCDGGARIKLDLKPAEAKFGLGFNYELRSEDVYVTTVLPLSPAARKGLTGGEQLLEVMARPVKRMSSAELRSLINSNAPQGVKLTVKKDGQVKQVEVKEGPIYLKGDT